MTALLFTLTLLLPALGQGNSQPQAGGVYRIRGVVVDAVTNVPVARAQILCFMAQGIVIGDFPGHPRITGDKTEYGKTTDECECEYDVDELVRDVDPA